MAIRFLDPVISRIGRTSFSAPALLGYSAITLVFLFCYFDVAFGAEGNLSDSRSIDIVFNASPDTVDAGKKIKFNLLLKSEGVKTYVNSTQLITPWGTIHNLVNQLVDTNRTLFKEFEVKIPLNASSGKYAFTILIVTPGADFDAATEVTIKKIQSIPLSGDIPLSVLVIIFSGIITYIIPVFILTRKFERSYIEVTIASIGLGLVNWLILNQINIIGDWGIISDEPQSITILMLFSLAMGLSIAFVLTRIFIPVYNRLKAREGVRKRIFDLKTTGYTIDEKVWIKAVERELERVKVRVGLGYSIVLKVKMKSDPKKTEEGILQFYEPKAPYDLVLRSNYRISTNDRQDLVRSLFDKGSPIYDELQDKTYRNKILAILAGFQGHDEMKSVTNDRLISDLKRELADELKTTKDFLQILIKIDISRFVGFVARKMTKTSVTHSYNDVLISGNDISSVEIIRYQCGYEIALIENSLQFVIPKPYEKSEFI